MYKGATHIDDMSWIVAGLAVPQSETLAPSLAPQEPIYELKWRSGTHLRPGDVRKRRGRTGLSTEVLRQTRATPAEYPSSIDLTTAWRNLLHHTCTASNLLNQRL